MRFTDTYEATLAEPVATDDGKVSIAAGERVRLTIEDDVSVGVHANGRFVLATLREVLGATLEENES